jgi:hypothetical protein
MTDHVREEAAPAGNRPGEAGDTVLEARGVTKHFPETDRP